MIPLKYNVRNMRVRWVTTVLTIACTALIVASTCLVFGMASGLRQSLKLSGDPLDLLVLRAGSSNETNSGIALSTAETVPTLDGIASDEAGHKLIALELLNIPTVRRRDGNRANLIVRGVDLPASTELRPSFQIVEGQMFEPGLGQCIVARNIARGFEGAGLGEILQVGEKESYRVVGIFTAGGSAAESEVWVDRRDLERNIARDGSITSIQLRAESPEAMRSLQNVLNEDSRFKLKAWSESEFYETQTKSSLVLLVFGGLIAAFLSVGAMFAAANTMFAAVKNRTREIGTMRALGFSRADILISFLGESLLLCLLGGLLGLLLVLPLGWLGLKFDLNSFDTFAEVTGSVRIDGPVMIVALVMTVAMGLFGGLFPALRAVRLDVIRALREA